jgi:hypothetical protein
MKAMLAIMGAGMVGLLGGCATSAVTLAPVGPNPATAQSLSAQGSLVVFSRLSRQTDDQNQASRDPIWYQHTDYLVYDLQGRVVKRVQNAEGHYNPNPRLVNLPAGQYIVKAQAANYSTVRVMVTVKGGETTKLHLDGQWRPPSYAGKGQVVTMPDGQPVGWRM